MIFVSKVYRIDQNTIPFADFLARLVDDEPTMKFSNKAK